VRVVRLRPRARVNGSVHERQIRIRALQRGAFHRQLLPGRFIPPIGAAPAGLRPPLHDFSPLLLSSLLLG
jgi:hypothetical protein